MAAASYTILQSVIIAAQGPGSKLAMAVGLSVVVLAGATGWALRPVTAQVPAEKAQVPSAKPKENVIDLKGTGIDDTLALLQNKRHEAAVNEWNGRWKEYEAGRGPLTILLESGRRVLDSQLALSDKPADRTAAFFAS